VQAPRGRPDESEADVPPWLAARVAGGALLHQVIECRAVVGSRVHGDPIIARAGLRGAVFSAPSDGVQALARPHARVLVHREHVDDTVGGLLGGYLVKSGMIKDAILATAVIQQILGRALGPEGRMLIPVPSSQ